MCVFMHKPFCEPSPSFIGGEDKQKSEGRTKEEEAEEGEEVRQVAEEGSEEVREGEGEEGGEEGRGAESQRSTASTKFRINFFALEEGEGM